jgi:hypothetical protein
VLAQYVLIAKNYTISSKSKTPPTFQCVSETINRLY